MGPLEGRNLNVSNWRLRAIPTGPAPVEGPHFEIQRRLVSPKKQKENKKKILVFVTIDFVAIYTLFRPIKEGPSRALGRTTTRANGRKVFGIESATHWMGRVPPRIPPVAPGEATKSKKKQKENKKIFFLGRLGQEKRKKNAPSGYAVVLRRSL